MSGLFLGIPIIGHFLKSVATGASDLFTQTFNFKASAYAPESDIDALLIESRSTSAWALQNDGTYVERYGPRTNAIRSNMAGTVVGTIGSGGSLPSGWSSNYTMEVLDFDDSPESTIDLNLSGTTPEFPAFFFQPISEADGLIVEAGDEVTFSMYVTRLAGTWDTISNLNVNIQQRTITDTFISSIAAATLSDLELGERRLVELTITITDPTAVRCFGVITSSSNGGFNRDFSIRIEKAQLEVSSKRTTFIYGDPLDSVPPELAIGTGIGLQVSKSVENLLTNSEQTGVTLGVIGSGGALPTSWALAQVGAGLTYEVTEIGTLQGLPSFKLRITGTAASSAQTFIRSRAATTLSIPAVLGDFFALNFIARVAAGSINGVHTAWMDNAMWDGVAAFQGRPTANWREEFSISNLDGTTKRYSTWVEIEDADTQFLDPTINLKYTDGEVIDLTFEVAGFNATSGVTEYPIVIGTGVGVTRDGDNPVVVQGTGAESITGDRDDFTGAIVLDSAVVTADQLGDADLVDLSAHVNARALYNPVATLTEGTLCRFMIELRSVSGTGTYPIAALDGNSIVSTQLVSLTEDFSTHFIDVLISAKPWSGGTPGIYIGNRRDVAGETLDMAYVKQGSIKQIMPWQGYDATGVESGIQLATNADFLIESFVGWVLNGAGLPGAATIDNGTLSIVRNSSSETEYVTQEITGLTLGRVHDFKVSKNGVYTRMRAGSTFGGLDYINDQDVGNIPAGTYSHPFILPASNVHLLLLSLTNSSTVEITHAGLQEIEPGVIIEQKAIWGADESQHAFRLDDTGNANTFILCSRTSGGKIRIKVEEDDVTFYDNVSTVDWPDDTEATFRFEMTNTGTDCFVAVFLDGVFVVGSGEFGHIEAINNLSFAPVTGAITYKEIGLK